MSCRVNKTVKIKDSFSNQHLPIAENENLNQLGLFDESIVEPKKESVSSTSTKKRQKRFNSFKFCRKSKIVEVVKQNTPPDDCDQTDLKGKDEQEKVDPLNEVRSSSLNSEANIRKPEKLETEKSSVEADNKDIANMAPSRRNRPEVSVKYQNAVHERVDAETGNGRMNTPKFKKNRKKNVNTEEDIQLVYKNQLASLNTADPETYTYGIAILDSQPTVEEESDLIENAEEERKRNKQRVRTKKMKENMQLPSAKVMNKLDIAYQNAQREIGKVLEPQNKDIEMESKYLSRGEAKKKKDAVEIDMEDDEANSSDEKESLEKTRQKMHKLLDEAFSVSSQKKPSINKVEPSRQSSHEVNSSSVQGNLKRTEQVVQTDISMHKEMIHTPIQVHHSLKFRDQANLITWSPYRAYDDAILISLSNSEENLYDTQGHENITTTIFEQPFSPHSKYCATEPGEPIIIKTKNLELNLWHDESTNELSTRKHSYPSDSHKRPPFNAISRNQVNFQKFVYDGTLSSHSVAVHLDSKITNDKVSDIHEIQTEDLIIPASKYMCLKEGGEATSGSCSCKNYDIVDVIKESLQPGVSPQPLINSLRKELQTLSSKRSNECNAMEKCSKE